MTLEAPQPPLLPPAHPGEPRPLEARLRTIQRFPGYGARPFSDVPEQQAVFFGREGDTERVFHAILASRLVVLYGVSGVGKTSLLKAGVFPRLMAEDLFPILLRIRPGDSPAAILVPELRQACKRAGLELTGGNTDDLWEFFKTAVIWRESSPLTPVLVLDQFEEFFRLEPKLRPDQGLKAACALEIGSLVSGIPPERRRRFARAEGRRKDSNPPDVRVLISLREEDFGALQDLSPMIPGLFQERIRLAPLSTEQAREALAKAAGYVLPSNRDGLPAWMSDATFAGPPFNFEPEAMELVVQELQGASGEIEPWEIQQVGAHLERVVAAKRLGADGRVHLGVEDVRATRVLHQALDDFYLDAIRNFFGAQTRQVRALCEEGLLTRSGNRVMLEASQIRQDYHLNEEVLAELDQLHIVRHERRSGGVHYELSHDRLAEAIARNRRWRLPKKYRLVLPVLGGLGLVIVIAGALAVNRQARMNQANEFSREITGALLDQEFVEELVQLGRIDALDSLKGTVEQFLNKRASDSWILHVRSVADRLGGEIAIGKGLLQDALSEFRQSTELLQELHEREPANSEWTLELLRVLQRYGSTQQKAGLVSAALDTGRQGLKLSEAVLPRFTAESTEGIQARLAEADLHLLVGDSLLTQHKPDEAVDHYREAIWLGSFIESRERAHRRTVLRRALSSTAAGTVGAGDVFLLRGENVQAAVAYSGALDVVIRLNDVEPFSVEARRTRAVVLSRLANSETDPDRALEQQRRILQRTERIARWNENNVQWRRDRVYCELLVTDALVRVGARRDAAKLAEKVLVEFRDLERIDPTSVEAHDDLVDALLSAASMQWRDPARTREEMAEADRILETASKVDATNADLRVKRAVNILVSAGARENGEEELKRVAAADRSLSEVLWSGARSISAASAQLALLARERELLAGQGRLTEAQEVDARRLRLFNLVREREPESPRVLTEQALVGLRAGRRARDHGQWRVAIEAFERSLEILEEAAERDPREVQWHKNLSDTYQEFAELLDGQGQTQRAETKYLASERAALAGAALRPKVPEFQRLLLDRSLRYVQFRVARDPPTTGTGGLRRRLEGARRIAAASIEFDPEKVEYQRFAAQAFEALGVQHEDLGREREAVGLFRQQATLGLQGTHDSSGPPEMRWLAFRGELFAGRALARTERVDEAREAYRRALRLAQEAPEDDPRTREAMAAVRRCFARPEACQ